MENREAIYLEKVRKFTKFLLIAALLVGLLATSVTIYATCLTKNPISLVAIVFVSLGWGMWISSVIIYRIKRLPLSNYLQERKKWKIDH